MPTETRLRVVAIFAIIYLALSALFPGAPASAFWFLGLLRGDTSVSYDLNLRPGIDMVGGTSLLYEIQVPEGGEVPSDLSERVATAIKPRIDPQGVINIVYRPQGARRLEIQMPLTGDSERARAARETYAQAQQRLEATNARPAAVMAAAERGDTARLAELAGDSQVRQDLFAELRRAQAELAAAREAQDVPRIARAEIALEELERDIRSTNLTADELERALELPDGLQAVGEDEEDRAAALTERAARVAAIKSRYAGFESRLRAINEFAAAHDDYQAVAGQIEDTAGLKAKLRGSGVLEFYILADPQRDAAEYGRFVEQLQERGPRPQAGDSFRWFEVDPEEVEGFGNRLIEYNGRPYALVWNTQERSMTVSPGGEATWALESATIVNDQGERKVGFRFDAPGRQQFGELTRRFSPQGADVYQLGVVLDDVLISAPNINGFIPGVGVIEGGGREGFSEGEAVYLRDTLNAGALPAKLTDDPIVERTIGPSLGRDNLRRGLLVSGFGVVVVAIFLISYYYLSGIVATVAVVLNLLLILASMAVLEATFTLPGVAGIILSLGMAVDANVLIFERLREEQRRGLSIRQALANAYDNAFSAIIDSNVTTFITAAILYFFGSEEVRGFGLTLMIGTVVSLFTALYVTKTIFAIMVNNFGVTDLGSVPRSFPKWDKILTPDIDWMGKVWVLSAASAAIIAVGLGFFGYFAFAKNQMLDIEFASGTAVQIELTEPDEIRDVRQVVGAEEYAAALPAVNVQSVESPGVEDGKTYEIITVNTDAGEVRDTILQAFSGRLQLQQPSQFAGSDEPYAQAAGVRVVPVTDGMGELGGYDVPGLAEFAGGAAVLLDGLDPPLSPSEIKARIEQARLQPDAGAAADLTGIEVLSVPGEGNSAAAVVVFDPRNAYDADRPQVVRDWADLVAAPLWDVTRSAVNAPAQLQKVTNFNPQVADEFKADATIAVLLSILVIVAYIWLRFGNLKYGTATIVALAHDTLFTIAAIGYAHLLAETFFGDFLLLEAFRFNLTMVAAILTVMGFSMNDTVVVFDRIRENRDKVGHVDRRVINNSINQTLSRTLLTGTTTLVTIFVMYVFGGPGIHAFTFAMLIGILTGTYSSIAIASPILLLGGAPVERPRPGEDEPDVIDATGAQVA